MSAMKSVNIADLDCVYLADNQAPNEQVWSTLQNQIPGIRRADTYQTAAKSSNTEHFIVVTNNTVPDNNFFQQTLELTDSSTTCQWRSRNHINGLIENNGLILATRGSINGDLTQMHDCYSTAYHNASAFQAWVAGFRAGVELCLQEGSRPVVNDFVNSVSQSARDQLSIWHNIGRDVDHGIWSIAGSRMGTYMMMITPQWDYHAAQDTAELEKIWATVQDSIPEILAGRVAEDLDKQLNLPMLSVLGPESAFFKQHYHAARPNQGPMIPA